MDLLSNTQIWLIMAVIFIIIELFSMSLYLLVIAASFLIGSLLAYFNAPLYLQTFCVCLSIALGLFFLSQFKKNKKNQANPSQNLLSLNHLDIGARVWVDVSQIQANQLNQPLQVNYKGAVWQARLLPFAGNNQNLAASTTSATSTTLNPAGWYIIKNIEKNTLILELDLS